MKGKESEFDIAAELVKAEMVTMMINDAIEYPTKLVRPPKIAGNFKFEKFDEQELKQAKKMLEAETAELAKTLGAISFDDYMSTWQRCNDDLIYLPHVKKFTLMSLTKSEPDKIRAQQYQYEAIKADLDKTAKKSKYLQSTLEVYLGGYYKVAHEKERNIHQIRTQISEARVELDVFKTLREKELKSIPIRIEALKKEVDNQRMEEVDLQKRFANLVQRKNELLQQQAPQYVPLVSAQVPQNNDLITPGIVVQ